MFGFRSGAAKNVRLATVRQTHCNAVLIDMTVLCTLGSWALGRRGAAKSQDQSSRKYSDGASGAETRRRAASCRGGLRPYLRCFRQGLRHHPSSEGLKDRQTTEMKATQEPRGVALSEAAAAQLGAQKYKGDRRFSEAAAPRGERRLR